jgi:hypothetical protein
MNMNMKRAARRLTLSLSTLMLGVSLAGCGGGGGGLTPGEPPAGQTRVFDATFNIPGDEIGALKKSHLQTRAPAQQGKITVKVPNLDITPTGEIEGTVESNTLGTFTIHGTREGDGRLTATGSSNGVTATFEGNMIVNPDGSRVITGTLSFSNSQSVDLTLNAPPPATSSPFIGSYSGTYGGDYEGTFSITVDNYGTISGTYDEGYVAGSVNSSGVIVFGDVDEGYTAKYRGNFSGTALSGTYEVTDEQGGGSGTFQGSKTN